MGTKVDFPRCRTHHICFFVFLGYKSQFPEVYSPPHTKNMFLNDTTVDFPRCTARHIRKIIFLKATKIYIPRCTARRRRNFLVFQRVQKWISRGVEHIQGYKKTRFQGSRRRRAIFLVLGVDFERFSGPSINTPGRFREIFRK